MKAGNRIKLDLRKLGGSRRVKVPDKRHGEAWGMQSYRESAGIPHPCAGSRRCWRVKRT